jgi:hypothetical protein
MLVARLTVPGAGVFASRLRESRMRRSSAEHHARPDQFRVQMFVAPPALGA